MNFQAIGLDVADRSPVDVDSFRVRTGITYPLCLNASGTAHAYGLPKDYSLLIDQQGIIRYIGLGADTVTMVALIDSMLATTAIDPENTPGEFWLAPNYPNPFNPSTHLRFRMADFGFTKLTIYDVQGREVTKLLAENLSPGSYEITWDGTDNRGRPVSSGIYIYRLTRGKFSLSRKMVLLR